MDKKIDGTNWNVSYVASLTQEGFISEFTGWVEHNHPSYTADEKATKLNYIYTECKKAAPISPALAEADTTATNKKKH